VLYGGGLHPLNPFYVGLYGGSEVPGVLDSDTVTREVLAARGYQEIQRTTLLQRELGGFESLVDRRQMQVRRQMLVEVTSDAPTRTWWDACIMGEFELTRFDLVPRSGGAAIASATFRSLESGVAAPGGRAAGLLSISVEESHRRRGLAVFLLSEAFRQFLRQGIVRVEAQARQDETLVLQMMQKLGFRQINQGGVWRKD
jgi:GNAT superfamily N-acetyltransferase